MKKVKYLTIRFKNPIGFGELPKFRGAVLACVERGRDLYHNHKADGGFHYRYPLIQYKRMGNSAGIVCLEDGVHDIHAFFMRQPQKMRLGNRHILPEVEQLRLNEVTMQAWDTMFHYKIKNWLALNPEHYKAYQSKDTDEKRNDLLASILRGNILSMAKGLGWFIDREVKVDILQTAPMQLASFKNQKLSSFNLSFSCNVWLPPFVGLGKGAALGFGMVEGAEVPKLKNN